MKVVHGLAGARAILLNVPLFAKVMGIALGMVVLLCFGLLWQLHHSYYNLEVREVESYAGFIAQVLATASSFQLREGRIQDLQLLLEEMVRIKPEINAVQVRDGGGRVLAKVGPVDPKAGVLEQSASLDPALGGEVSVALCDNHIDFELGWHTKRLVQTTLLVVPLGMVLLAGLMRLITRPILELARVVREVKSGNYQVRATVHARDEVGELAVAFNDMLAALQQKDAVNHQLLRRIIGAAEEERKRVARELHDHTGQSLTCLIASLAAMQKQERSAEVTGLIHLAAQTLRDVHDLSRMLRPSTLDDLGLVAALQKFCKDFAQRLHVPTDFAAIGLDSNSRLPGVMEVALYRITQEALTNAVRHGQARAIEVLLQRQPGTMLLIIEDDGRGFQACDWRAHCLHGDHLGLLGMEERALLLGGTLRIESQPNQGVRLFVKIPLPEIAHA